MDKITPMQPQNQLPAHHVSHTMKVLMLIFAVLLTATLGYFIWAFYSSPDQTDYSNVLKKKVTPKTTTTTTTTETKAVSTDTAIACGDTKLYGFSLTFGNLWTGYKIKEVKPDYSVVTCYFELPTISTDATWAIATTDHDAKYASLFAVSVYTPAQWTTSQVEANKPTELGHNANYYWAWSPAQAYPEDLKDAGADAKNVVTTFKIVE